MPDKTDYWPDAVANQAAVLKEQSETIDALRAEIERQSAELDDLDTKLGSALRAIGLEHAENERLKAAVTEIGVDHVQRVQRLEAENELLRAALEGVLAEADRKTDAFDRAHAALERPNCC